MTTRTTTRTRIAILCTAAGLLALAVSIPLAVSGSGGPGGPGGPVRPGGHATSALRHAVLRHAALAASSCGGPTGAAYVADPGYQGFTAVDTANCEVIQTYNVDDLPVPGDSGDYNYVGSDEGIALSGTTLWFAVTGTDNVAAIDTTTLDPNDYNPAETLVPVGYMPEALAATPDGSEVWVIDSGPQTTTSPLWDVEVIDTSTDTVTGRLDLAGDPTDVAFSPDGQEAYVTTTDGLSVYDVQSERQVAFVAGLGSPKSVAVAPDGSAVYVTETSNNELATIDAATDRVTRTTPVGQEPWQAVVSPDGSRVYVANPDSDSVSVVDAGTGQVADTYPLPGDPDTLGLTPDGTQLWVAGDDSGVMTVIDTATGQQVGSTNLGGDGPNSGDGLDPTGMVLTATPTPTS
jgi:YVTN family beta-propeller protein